VVVEDLLTLARMDEVRDASREPVDIGVLAGDAVDDARSWPRSSPRTAVVRRPPTRPAGARCSR